MARTYKIIDADGHILEPPTLWQDYIDPRFRDRAPQLVTLENGTEVLKVDGRTVGGGPGKGIGSAGGVGARQGDVEPLSLKYLEGRKGGFDPHARIEDMGLDGIDAAFLYPSIALMLGASSDIELMAANCRAYNRWIVDYCAPYPDRLFGVAMLPMQSVDAAISEMKYAHDALGLRAGFIRPNPYGDRPLHARANDPFWAEAQRLDFSIGLHEGSASGQGMPQLGADRFETPVGRHIVTHCLEMQAALVSMIWGGVCERFPKLRVAFLEGGGGWVAGILDRLDRHFDDVHDRDPSLKRRPSDIFRENCWISFEPVERTLPLLVDYVGSDRILWATDYPHADGFFPGAPKMITELLENARPETLHNVLAGGAMGFYQLS